MRIGLVYWLQIQKRKKVISYHKESKIMNTMKHVTKIPKPSCYKLDPIDPKTN